MNLPLKINQTKSLLVKYAIFELSYVVRKSIFMEIEDDKSQNFILLINPSVTRQWHTRLVTIKKLPETHIVWVENGVLIMQWSNKYLLIKITYLYIIICHYNACHRVTGPIAHNLFPDDPPTKNLQSHMLLAWGDAMETAPLNMIDVGTWAIELFFISFQLLAEMALQKIGYVFIRQRTSRSLRKVAHWKLILLIIMP